VLHFGMSGMANQGSGGCRMGIRSRVSSTSELYVACSVIRMCGSVNHRGAQTKNSMWLLRADPDGWTTGGSGGFATCRGRFGSFWQLEVRRVACRNCAPPGSGEG